MIPNCVCLTGHAHSFDDVIIDGSLEEQKFVAYYVKWDAFMSCMTLFTYKVEPPASDHPNSNLTDRGTSQDFG